MFEREGLLEAILKDPDDDTSRLVYADYLDEHGDDSDRARAEFIRIGCEVARLPQESQQRAELQRREDELLASHGKHWCRNISKALRGDWTERSPHRFHWQRGFPWGGRVDAFEFLSAIERTVFWEPVFGVELEGSSPDDDYGAIDPQPEWLDRLAASPLLRLVGAINLCETHFCLDNRPDRFVKLISAQHLSRLTDLSVFMDYVGLPGVRAVVEAPAGFRLRRLMLGCFIEPEYAERSREEDFLEAVRLIAASPRMAALEYFDLDASYDAEDRQDEAAALLLASKHLPRSMQLRFGWVSALTAGRRAQLAQRFRLIREPGDES